MARTGKHRRTLGFAISGLDKDAATETGKKRTVGDYGPANGGAGQWPYLRSIILQMEARHMELFHGSNVIIGTPRLLGLNRGLDFGPGFYLTSSQGQAARLSKIIHRRRGAGRPTVNVYEFDIPAAEKALTVLKFG
jgi:hypothetical protein